jgi:type IV pilus assembly protein PilP
MTMKRTLVAIGVAATAIFAACGNDAAAPAPAATPAAAAKPKAAAAVGASPDGGTEAESAQYVYSYNPVGKRDPFRSPLGDPNAKKENSAENPNGGECQEPLCLFDIEQLALVAVVSGDANPIAMLEDPNRTGHIVRRNTKVGKQGGKVTQILRDCIVITEYFLGPDGKKNPNRVNICVKKEAAQAPTIDLLINKAVE